MATTTTSSSTAPVDLGGRLVFYRIRAGLSRDAAAARVTPGFRTLCMFETNARVPNLLQLRELGALYGVPVVDLLGAEDHAPTGGAAA